MKKDLEYINAIIMINLIENSSLTLKNVLYFSQNSSTGDVCECFYRVLGLAVSAVELVDICIAYCYLGLCVYAQSNSKINKQTNKTKTKISIVESSFPPD